MPNSATDYLFVRTHAYSGPIILGLFGSPASNGKTHTPKILRGTPYPIWDSQKILQKYSHHILRAFFKYFSHQVEGRPPDAPFGFSIWCNKYPKNTIKIIREYLFGIFGISFDYLRLGRVSPRVFVEYFLIFPAKPSQKPKSYFQHIFWVFPILHSVADVPDASLGGWQRRWRLLLPHHVGLARLRERSMAQSSKDASYLATMQICLSILSAFDCFQDETLIDF